MPMASRSGHDVEGPITIRCFGSLASSTATLARMASTPERGGREQTGPHKACRDRVAVGPPSRGNVKDNTVKTRDLFAPAPLELATELTMMRPPCRGGFLG
jgi:hypothetical protein